MDEQRKAARVLEGEVQHHERGLSHLDGAQTLPRPAGPATREPSTARLSSSPSSVLVDGPRREIERTKSSSLYETEGLAIASALNGELHWQIQPQIPFYGSIISFRPAT
jgi:hypothetical protein